MPASEPGWWYAPNGTWQAALLSPIAAIFGAVASRRIRNAKPYRSSLPVVCVGNFTAGGSGKTPLSLLIARILAEAGREPWFLSRGYGGKLPGPVKVDLAHHSAADVGDEPLLLARAFPVVVSRDRREGAQAIEKLATGSAVIVMDDGLQNPTLAKDLSIAVVDAKRGFGNGRVIPAGPLRAPLALQAKLAELIVAMGDDAPPTSPAIQSISRLTNSPVIAAETRPEPTADRFRGHKVLAYAGIANPDRFFATLQSVGAELVGKRAFADHHPFSQAEAEALLDDAERFGASLVTTEKDFARLSGQSGACAELKQRSDTLAIATVLKGDGMDLLRSSLLRAARARTR